MTCSKQCHGSHHWTHLKPHINWKTRNIRIIWHANSFFVTHIQWIKTFLNGPHSFFLILSFQNSKWMKFFYKYDNSTQIWVLLCMNQTLSQLGHNNCPIIKKYSIKWKSRISNKPVMCSSKLNHLFIFRNVYPRQNVLKSPQFVVQFNMWSFQLFWNVNSKPL